MSAEISVENLGPIPQFSFQFRDHGVTVLTAPCGSGKSLLLESVSKLAAGGGRLPLRDGAKRGSVEGFGARISIAATCRHTNEFEVSHLEGRFDLSELVDPGLDKPEAADRKRIRALVTLTGAKPDATLFSSHKAFGSKEEFDKIVQQASLEKTDPVDMAEAIKRDYEAAARRAEDEAQREIGQAKGLEEAIGEFDPNAESDETVLEDAFAACQARKTNMDAWRKAVEEANAKQIQANKRLEAAVAGYQGPTVEQAEADTVQCREEVTASRSAVDVARKALIDAEAALKESIRRESEAANRLSLAHQHERVLRECRELIAGPGQQGPTAEEIAAVEEDLAAARRARDYGVLVRNAKEKRAAAEAHREAHKQAVERAGRMREAAGAIDEVLSGMIQGGPLRVESVDGKARLVVTHPKRGTTPYHELSAGEKWTVAIDLAADVVGEGGLIVIPQHAWEGIDAFLRPAIDQHAKQRKVYVLTAEATRNAEDGEGMKAVPFAETVGA